MYVVAYLTPARQLMVVSVSPGIAFQLASALRCSREASNVRVWRKVVEEADAPGYALWRWQDALAAPAASGQRFFN